MEEKFIESEILVSVSMITYNHEKYIAQAIEGVLMQKTNFKIELIIGEDYSTDNTRQICIDYGNKYPEIIRLRLPEKNLGMQQNGLENGLACTGKYIALCEGDDYWTDPSKLQKQVDFLEANAEYSICFHPIKIWKDNEIIDDYITPEVAETTDIIDLANGNFMHTPSVVFRYNKEVIEQFKTINAPIGDYVLHMLNARYGKIKRLTECMAVYRVHEGGVHSLMNQNHKNRLWAKMLEELILTFSDDTKFILKSQYINTIITILEDNSELEKDVQQKYLMEIYNYDSTIFINKFKELVEVKNNYQTLQNNLKSIKKVLRILKNIIATRFFF